MIFLQLIVLTGLVCVSVAAKPPVARFDDFKVYKVDVKDEAQLQEFKKLGDNIPLRYLSDIGSFGRAYDVILDPANRVAFQALLQYHQFEYTIVTEDLQTILDARQTTEQSSALEWTSYHSLEEIYDWVDYLPRRHLSTVQKYTIGHSYEGRAIKALKLSRKSGNKAIFIEANIHAIEWISSAAGTCFFNNLLNSKDEKLRSLASNYDWIFVPVLNVDGFEYTHNVEPLWRKNRKPTGFSNSSGLCYGTDLNRNFDYKWSSAGHNVDEPCDHWYGGPAASSEPEVEAIQEFVQSFPDNYICMYLALHSYGNLVLLPYGHTTEEVPTNYDQMMRISKGFADAAVVKYGTKFAYGSTSSLMYPVSGASKDWAYGVQNIPYTATIELRDRGTYGFFLPAEQIIEVCEEITDGFVGLITAAEEENLCY